jgi:nucleotide-binding universal stress UspA family protein
MKLNDEVLGMTSRTNSTSLFVVIDESVASRHTLQYVGALVGKRRGFRIVLGYVLPPLPTELLEFGGAENPENEKKLSKELKGEQKRWLSGARRKARDIFTSAHMVLRRARVPGSVVKTTTIYLPEGQDPVDKLLEVADLHRCHTIVIGRHPVSRFQEFFGGDPAEKLVRRIHGPAVWVTSSNEKKRGRGRQDLASSADFTERRHSAKNNVKASNR